VVAGASAVGLVGLVGLALQQGLFKRKKSEDKPFDWNNWGKTPEKP
jgi:hypothetical protein